MEVICSVTVQAASPLSTSESSQLIPQKQQDKNAVEPSLYSTGSGKAWNQILHFCCCCLKVPLHRKFNQLTARISSTWFILLNTLSQEQLIPTGQQTITKQKQNACYQLHTHRPEYKVIRSLSFAAAKNSCQKTWAVWNNMCSNLTLLLGSVKHLSDAPDCVRQVPSFRFQAPGIGILMTQCFNAYQANCELSSPSASSSRI